MPTPLTVDGTAELARLRAGLPADAAAWPELARRFAAEAEHVREALRAAQRLGMLGRMGKLWAHGALRGVVVMTWHTYDLAEPLLEHKAADLVLARRLLDVEPLALDGAPPLQ
jgi:hypothetical protein